VLNDQSGLYADFTGLGSVEAARMAVQDFGGNVLGREVLIVSADHANNVEQATRTAQVWFDQDVAAIVDLPNSAVALAVQKLGRELGRITIVSGAGSADLTGSACSPTGFHWTFDTYSNSVGLARELVGFGRDSWYFITADYAFGWSLEREATRAVTQAGGRVVGAVRHPINFQEFGPLLTTAQDSGAKVIGLANAGGDTIRLIRQAAELGISARSQTLVPMLVFVNDVHSLGLDVTKGMTFVDGFYWDMDEETRNWSRRFFAARSAMPSMAQAGVYSAVLHYLRAVAAAGVSEAPVVAATMRAMPVRDFFAKEGHIRVDGRMIHNMYLMQVKFPNESSAPWDYYKLVSTIPGDRAFRPLAESECPLVKQQPQPREPKKD
jgi:branched-chain amino acid transport system substrate-binding protein